MKYLISILIGAIIGYFTNWLAIKMLFKPYEEKRILGIKMPFTPGLIPKERYRISKSVGDSIGQYLLTEETIKNAMNKKEVKQVFKGVVIENIKKLFLSEKTIKQLGEEVLGKKGEKLILSIKNKASDEIIKYLNKEDIKDKFYLKLKGEVEPIFDKTLTSILDSEKGKDIESTIIKNILDYKNSQEFRKNINKFIEQKVEDKIDEQTSLGEIISDNFFNISKNYIYNHREDVYLEFKNILESDDVKKSIKLIVNNIIKTKLNPMVAMFMNPDAIYEKVFPIVLKNLDKEDTKIKIVTLINKELDKFKDKKVLDIVKDISEEDKKIILSEVYKAINENILSNENIKILLDKIKLKNKNLSIKDIIKKLSLDDKQIYNNLYNKILSNEQFSSFIVQISDKIINNLINRKLNTITNIEFFKDNLEISNDYIERIYDNVFENSGKKVIGAINISQIVEEKINELDVRFTEEIILNIASKELKAITYIGGVLGGIIGILSPIINNFL